MQVGSDPTAAPRYWYVYNGHGDVVALVDATGTPVASYSYDSWGNLLSSSEAFTNGWTNPYRYDGRDGARYDAATGLYWLSVRVYDPTLGRFLARDPLNRAPLFVSDNPYVYAGNNPLSNVDPSGQKVAGASAAQVKQAAKKAAAPARVISKQGTPKNGAKIVPLSLLKGCTLCAAIVNSLTKVAPAVVIGAVLVLIGVLADAFAVGEILKTAIEVPELAPALLRALAILGTMALAVDGLSTLTIVWGSGPISGVIHTILALLNFMAAAIKYALPIALAGGWAVGLLRVGLFGTVETEEGDAAPLDAAMTLLAGTQMSLWISEGASLLIGVGEGLVAWGNSTS